MIDEDETYKEEDSDIEVEDADNYNIFKATPR
jgi:hypothetical protein